MSKTISMDLEEYQQELNQRYLEGVKAGSTRLSAIVNDVLDNGGANLDISEDADPQVVEFIQKVKNAVSGQATQTN